MNKMFFAVTGYLVFGILSTGSVSHAFNDGMDPELAADVQLDSVFEAEQSEQLHVDKQFAVKDSINSQKELDAEKNRIKALKARNERLNEEIKKFSKIAKERRLVAQKENLQTRRLEWQVHNKQQQLEKLKIANVNLRKNIQQIKERQHKAMIKQARAEAIKNKQLALQKRLKEKKQKVISKSSRIRTAGL